MIRHLFTIIWNERRSNTWILLEYIVVFCVLWFCCDYTFIALRTYMREDGFDINHTYRIEMGIKPDCQSDDSTIKSQAYFYAQTLEERVKRYPGIEAISFAICAFPYFGCYSSGEAFINSDSSGADTPIYRIRVAQVSSGFSDVFRIKLREGSGFKPEEESTQPQIIITPFDHKGKCFGNFYESVDIDSIKTILTDQRRGQILAPPSGIAERPIKEIGVWSPLSFVYTPLSREGYDLYWNQIAIRVAPEADHDFPERFIKEMRDQLNIGPYYLVSVVPTQKYRQENIDDLNYGEGQLFSTYVIMGFVIINVFLGILGSFWFRIQSRRSEIGLRIALGSSKRKVQQLVVGETLLLLVLAAAIGTTVCLNLFTTNLIGTLGIPTIDRNEWGIGWEQDLLNFLIVFGFLTITSIGAVLYPARKASEISPSEALRSE